MWSFFGELLRRTDGPCTIIVMDDEYRAQPRQYLVHPQRILIFLGVAALTLALLVASLMAFTPLRDLIPGYGTTELRSNARRTAMQAREGTIRLRLSMTLRPVNWGSTPRPAPI